MTHTTQRLSDTELPCSDYRRRPRERTPPRFRADQLVLPRPIAPPRTSKGVGDTQRWAMTRSPAEPPRGHATKPPQQPLLPPAPLHGARACAAKCPQHKNPEDCLRGCQFLDYWGQKHGAQLAQKKPMFGNSNPALVKPGVKPAQPKPDPPAAKPIDNPRETPPGLITIALEDLDPNRAPGPVLLQRWDTPGNMGVPIRATTTVPTAIDGRPEPMVVQAVAMREINGVEYPINPPTTVAVAPPTNPNLNPIIIAREALRAEYESMLVELAEARAEARAAEAAAAAAAVASELEKIDALKDNAQQEVAQAEMAGGDVDAAVEDAQALDEQAGARSAELLESVGALKSQLEADQAADDDAQALALADIAAAREADGLLPPRAKPEGIWGMSRGESVGVVVTVGALLLALVLAAASRGGRGRTRSSRSSLF